MDSGAGGGVASEGASSDASGSSESVGCCLRFRDFSFARRALRSVAAASRDAWEAMVANEECWKVEWALLLLADEARD